MHLRLLYVALLALVFVCLQDVVALPTGTRLSGLERQMNQVKEGAFVIANAGLWGPKLGWDVWFGEKGVSTTEPGQDVTVEQIGKDFKNFFPPVQEAYETNVDKVKKAFHNFSPHMVYVGHIDRKIDVRHGHPSAYAFVETKHKLLFIAFAGTGSLADGLIDANGRKKVASTYLETFHKQGLQMHKGFGDVVDDVFAEKVIAWVKAAVEVHSITTVMVGGHSLGGAIANIIHAVLLDAMRHGKLKTLEVQTRSFAGPRVFEPEAARQFAKLYPNFRALHNKEDIVGKVAPTWMGYNHPPGAETIDKGPEQGAHSFPGGTDNHKGVNGNSLSNAQQAIADHAGPYRPVLRQKPDWSESYVIINPYLGVQGLSAQYNEPLKQR